MTVRELRKVLENLEKIDLGYADAKVIFRTNNDTDEEFEYGILDYYLNDALDEGYDTESVVILG